MKKNDNEIEIKKFKRIMLCGFDSTLCNFRCDYCYVNQIANRRKDKLITFKYPLEVMKRKLTIEALGGVCLFIITASGETFLQKEAIDFGIEMLKNGHFVEFTTNGSCDKIINDLINLPKELSSHLIFKISFHYLELKKKNLLDKFSKTVSNILNSKASFSLEMVASDIYIPYVKEIKKYSIENFGALPHLTIDRDDRTKLILYSTKNLDLYFKIFDSFDSKLFEFKKMIFLKPISFYCNAGLYSLFLQIDNGTCGQCYNSVHTFNLFESTPPYKFKPIGRHCFFCHCYNGHSLLAFGVAPNKFKNITYYDERDRITTSGKHWIKDSVKPYYQSKLSKRNNIFHRIANEITLAFELRKKYFVSFLNRRNIHKKLRQYLKSI